MEWSRDFTRHARRNTRADLGTPATLAVCCGARQGPWRLGAGTSRGLGERHNAHTAVPVRGAPSVGGDHRCLGAYIGVPGATSTKCAVSSKYLVIKWLGR